MERYTLDHDIKVFYVQAESFPDGIGAAYEKLHSLVDDPAERHQFGLSAPENGVIVYKAALEELNEGEGNKLCCETFVILEGEYLSITIYNFMKDIESIGNAFNELIANPHIDPQGVCIEWYLNEKDVKCTVKLR
jgi:hypothetical protein